MFTHELKCYISNKTQRTINIQGDIKMISLNLPTFYYVLHYCALPSKANYEASWPKDPRPKKSTLGMASRQLLQKHKSAINGNLGQSL